MGQYFTWVNYDKGEYLSNEPFPDGFKALESAYCGSVKTDAVSTLLAGDWHGDLVAFTGEYAFDLRSSDALEPWMGSLSRVVDHPLDYYDIEDELRDVASRFEHCLGREGYGLRGGSVGEFVYDGPCDEPIVHYRYVVNETRGVYYDRENTHNGRDPLPVLLGTSFNHLEMGDCGAALWSEGALTRPDGVWVGDVVSPTDDCPPGDYVDLSGVISIHW